VEKTLRENEQVQKKLSKYIEELTRAIEKNRRNKEEVRAMVEKLKRQYEVKKEQMKQARNNLKQMEEGKEVCFEDEGGADQLQEAKQNCELTQQEIK